MHDLFRAKLKLVNQYIIPFAGLKEGEHRFTCDLENKFFDEHNVLEVSEGSVTAEILLTKKPSFLELEFFLKGEVQIQCDKCLDNFAFPIRFSSSLIVKFSDDTSESNDEIWILSPGEHKLDLEQYLFESVGLCLPIQRLHPEDKKGNTACNTDMLNLLESYSSKNTSEDAMDPRWNELKKLMNDTNNN